MSFEVTRRRDNVLLARLELEIALSHDLKPTPTRDEVRKAVAEAESTKANLVIVKRMKSEFGHGRTRGWIHVYKDAEGLRRLEPLHLRVRHGLEEAKKGPTAQEKTDGAPAAAKKADQPPAAAKKADQPPAAAKKADQPPAAPKKADETPKA
jgi:small subunit ribosomal protein S24e